MITKLIEQLVPAHLSDEALYGLYSTCLSLTHAIKRNYGERLERYCFQCHNLGIENNCAPEPERNLNFIEDDPPF